MTSGVDNSALAEMLKREFDGVPVQVVGEGGHIHVTIVSDRFEGLSSVKRQQLVYHHLSEMIASGDIHAVTMTTHTPAEHEEA